MKTFLLFAIICSAVAISFGQSRYTTLPILYINAGTQSGSMGEISATASAMHTTQGILHNPALLIRSNKYSGIIANYSPFYYYNAGSFFANVGFMYTRDSSNAFAYSYNRFHIGPVQFENNDGIFARPHQYYHSVRYAHHFQKNIAAGMGVKIIHSNLGPGLFTPFNTFSIDLGLHHYKVFPVNYFSRLRLNTGIQIQDLGPQINHLENKGMQADNLPTTLIAGGMLSYVYIFSPDKCMVADVAYQVEGILYNTPRIYSSDSDGWLDEIKKGTSTQMPPIFGYFGSFGPRNAQNEMKTPTFIHKWGTEIRYIYKTDYYVGMQGGYLSEFETKGGEAYATTGISVGLFGFRIQFAHKFIDKHGISSLALTYARNISARTSRFAEWY